MFAVSQNLLNYGDINLMPIETTLTQHTVLDWCLYFSAPFAVVQLLASFSLCGYLKHLYENANTSITNLPSTDNNLALLAAFWRPLQNRHKDTLPSLLPFSCHQLKDTDEII